MAILSPPQLVDYDSLERRRYPAIYGEVQSSPQLSVVGRTDVIFLDQLRSTARGSRYVELEFQFNALRDQLASLRITKAGWDGYNAPTPNEIAIKVAESALEVLRNLYAFPTRVLPSADGGVGICFVQNGGYAHIEFENTGEVWGLMYGPTMPTTTWQLASGDAESVGEAWSKISASLQP